MPAIPRRCSDLASAASAAAARIKTAAAGRPSAIMFGWNSTGALAPVKADRSTDEPIRWGRTSADDAGHDRGEHRGHRLGHDQAGLALVAHHGEPGQGQL